MNLFEELTKKPWLETGGPEEPQGEVNVFALPRSTVGLRLFLLVVTVLFCLFIVAYSDRMLLPDWRTMPEPWLLWPNTLMLGLASIALYRANVVARRGQLDELKTAVATGGAFSLAFLAGQLFAWQILVAEGYYAATNPANAFFYVLTALHGLHLIGGLFVLAWTFARLRRATESEVEGLVQTVDLCAVYWHFLLVVWLVVFGLLLFT